MDVSAFLAFRFGPVQLFLSFVLAFAIALVLLTIVLVNRSLDNYARRTELRRRR